MFGGVLSWTNTKLNNCFPIDQLSARAPLLFSASGDIINELQLSGLHRLS